MRPVVRIALIVGLAAIFPACGDPERDRRTRERDRDRDQHVNDLVVEYRKLDSDFPRLHDRADDGVRRFAEAGDEEKQKIRDVGAELQREWLAATRRQAAIDNEIESLTGRSGSEVRRDPTYGAGVR